MTDKKRDAPETGPVESVLESSPCPQGFPLPVADRYEYGRLVNNLPAGDRGLADEVARHADLCRYFSENDMQVPPHICREVAESRKLAVPERAERLREINLELMEYLNSVSQDSGLRM